MLFVGAAGKMQGFKKADVADTKPQVSRSICHLGIYSTLLPPLLAPAKSTACFSNHKVKTHLIKRSTSLVMLSALKAGCAIAGEAAGKGGGPASALSEDCRQSCSITPKISQP